MIVPFGDGEYETHYEMTFIKSWFFGLFKEEITKKYAVPMYTSIKEQEAYWDNLIIQEIEMK